MPGVEKKKIRSETQRRSQTPTGRVPRMADRGSPSIDLEQGKVVEDQAETNKNSGTINPFIRRDSIRTTLPLSRVSSRSSIITAEGKKIKKTK